jgi:hypothetical protein
MSLASSNLCAPSLPWILCSHVFFVCHTFNPTTYCKPSDFKSLALQRVKLSPHFSHCFRKGMGQCHRNSIKGWLNIGWWFTFQQHPKTIPFPQQTRGCALINLSGLPLEKSNIFRMKRIFIMYHYIWIYVSYYIIYIYTYIYIHTYIYNYIYINI